jgi:hypothetical protein
LVFVTALATACGGSGSGSEAHVASVPGAPAISGIPDPEIPVGEEFVFEPDVSDPEGDELSFSIENKPEWAKFNTDSGTLAGTPQPGHEGLYSDIRIAASDGKNVSEIRIAVRVVTEGTASVQISWTPPTQYEDGTALTDLAGYYLYYGDEEGNYPKKLHIDNPAISTYVVEKLMEKTYYFVATAYNSEGRESRHSNVTVKVAM